MYALPTLSSSAEAAEIGTELRAGLTRTDNVFLTNENEVEDDIFVAGVTLEYDEETNRTIIDLRGVADYFDYQDSFEAEWVGGVDALLEYAFVPELFTWTILNNWGQRSIDPISAPVPENREDINFFSTGPDFRVPLGSKSFAALEGRYSIVTFESGDQDNDRVSAGLFAGRELGDVSSVAIGVTTESVEYENSDLFEDFDITEAIIRFEKESTRDLIGIDVGYTELELGEQAGDGYLIRADWTRISSRFYQFLFSGGSEYSSTGDVFRFTQSNATSVGSTIDANAIEAPFRRDFFIARFTLDRNRTALYLEANWSQEDYEFAPSDPAQLLLDRELLGVRVGIDRQLTNRVSITAGLDARTAAYDSIEEDLDDLLIAVQVDYELSEGFGMFAGWVRTEREGNDPTLDYTENRYSIGFTYVPAWAR
jgi:hypothetical protein